MRHQLADVTFAFHAASPGGHYGTAWHTGTGAEVYTTETHDRLEDAKRELHAGLCRKLRLPAGSEIVSKNGDRLTA